MIRILTDSTADFTPEQAAALGVEVVPLRLNFDGESYEDGELSPDEFYSRLAECSHLPTTSQPSPDAFLTRFEEAEAAGDQVVAILLSSQLSGTYQSATIAAEGLAGIVLVDSGTATLGLQLLVRYAAKLRDEGLTAGEIASHIEAVKNDVRIFAVIDDLQYLRKGGRLSGAGAFAGALLGIKPLVQIRDGKVTMAGKARGMAGAYVALFKMLDGENAIDTSRPFMAGYTGHPHAADPIRRYLTHNLGLSGFETGHIGPIVGTHAGPGAAGIAYFAKPADTAEEAAE